jgi:hypothetical protein
MDSDDAECAIITFLTGVIQGGASSPRIFIIFINALLEHLTSTGKALGISHGMVGTEQFNNIAFMDDITTLAQDSTGSQIEELSTPANIIAQELCNNIRRSLVHDDVAKSITVMELQRAKEEWMCHTLYELYDEMELWGWLDVQHNRWARALKASKQVNVRPMWYIEDT